MCCGLGTWLADEAFWSAGVMVGLEGFEGFLLLTIIHSQ